MKKLILCCLTAMALVACSVEDDSGSGNPQGISNEPLSGTLYSVAFDADAGRADYQTVFGEEMLVIQLSSEGLACETGEFSGDFPISITAPPAEGSYEQGIYVSFNDPNSESFISVSSGIDMEIITITETSVEFKIRVQSSTTNNELEGLHEVTICQ